jgi:trans-2,3-dihydro-3-hydroxyanthranilate isomerase
MSGQCAAGELVLEEGVGPVPVSTRQDGASFSARLRLERAPDVPDRVSPPDDMAAVLSITPDDVVDVFCAGMGVNFTFVQVPSREIVDRSQLDHQAWARLLADQWGAQVYVFAGDLTDGSEIYARMYGPGLGITEDPATGAAAAAITGAAALRHPLPSSAIRLDIRQGVKMGRPSLIRTSATVEAGDLRSIEVGGGCVFVAEGQIEVPDDLMGRSYPVDL